jgi:hypothetical protein
LKSQNQDCIRDDCEDGFDCLPNKNLLTKLFKAYTCQKYPTEGEYCLEKCSSNYYCGWKDIK